MSDGADAEILDALLSAAQEEGATVELVAPTVGGVQTSDGSRREADEQVDGGPSVLYDVVVLLPSEDGAAKLAGNPAARDFVSDAYAHAKFIGCGAHASALFAATGLGDAADEGIVEIAGASDVEPFLSRCRALRFWEREG